MTLLNALTLATYAVSTERAPQLERRRKLAQKIAEQIKLASDSSYVPTKVTWHKNAEGIDQRVTVPKRVKRWWTERVDGPVLLTVRYGSKALELAKGKNAIVVSSTAELPALLQNLKAAVEGGEFDKLLEQQVGYGKRSAKP
jgi:hypothetical protein